MLNYNEYNQIVAECRDLSIRKNKDYGSYTMERFGMRGIVIRLNDKQDRLVNLIWTGNEALVSEEKIEDTAKDMINYAVYLIMLSRGRLTAEEAEK